MALKIAGAVTEAKEMKIKKEREQEAMEEEMARLKKAEEQKKTLMPARFVHNSNVEKEAKVALANVTLSSVSSLSLSSECNQQQQQKQSLCCTGDYCFASNGHKVVCGMTCRVCDKSCHLACCESDEYGYKICYSCEKGKACNKV